MAIQRGRATTAADLHTDMPSGLLLPSIARDDVVFWTLVEPRKTSTSEVSTFFFTVVSRGDIIRRGRWRPPAVYHRTNNGRVSVKMNHLDVQDFPYPLTPLSPSSPAPVPPPSLATTVIARDPVCLVLSCIGCEASPPFVLRLPG